MRFYLAISSLLVLGTACSQINLNKIKQQANVAISKVATANQSLSQDDVVKGLKEALTVGSNKSASKASKVDGFLKNPAIKIPFPPEAEKIKTTVETLGMKSQVDKFVTTLNRAAEEASKEAAPIFIDAIKNISIQDGFKILKGEDNAATKYLEQNTTAKLRTQFAPIVKQAISKVEVTRYWNPIVSKYNKLPMVQKLNPNLEDYVIDRSLKGLFTLIANEEKEIRENPAARVSDILKKVFGNG